jgi:DNA-binding transcriptional regulator YdaS (Cro superfamily)
MSDWSAALREECEKTSQVAVARRLGISASTINQILKGVYKGNLTRFETLVRGELMRETVVCPVMGEITKRRCHDEQRRPFAVTNPVRVAVWRACRDGCPHSTIRE